MGVAKASIGNSSFIGAYAIATDLFSILSARATPSEEKFIQDTLGARVIRSTIDGSDLIGIYVVANSRGLIVPEIAQRSEVAHLKEQLKDLDIEIVSTDLNALRNNILVNDKVAFINAEYGRKEATLIEDTFDVEVVKRNIGAYNTVGASNVATNKGFALNNNASEDDISVVRNFSKNVSQTTANLGSSSIGLCVIANSNGMLVGDETTGFEMVRLTEGLDL